MSILQSNESHITINADGASKEVRFQNNGTQNMVLDSSGNVGIGTASPTHTLEVNGGANNQVVKLVSTDAYAAIGLQDSTSSTDGSGNSYNSIAALGNNLTFWANNAERLRITSSGNVGIGTTSPAYELEVKGDAAAIQVSSADYDVALLGRRGSSAADYDKGYLRLRDTGVTKVSIDSAGGTYFNGGNVGIGTNSPSAGLHVLTDVNPTLKLDRGSANNTNANLYYNGTFTGQISAANTDFQISAVGASTPISFYTNGTEKMRILASNGITFNGDTAAANALDDYEEGTFTYAFSPASGTINTRSGYTKGFYTKVGRVVHISIRYETNSISSPSGDLYITGLPFTSAGHPTDGSNNNNFPIVLRDATGVSNISNAFVNLPQNGNSLRFLYVNSSATISSFDASYVSSSFQGTIAFSYVT